LGKSPRPINEDIAGDEVKIVKKKTKVT